MVFGWFCAMRAPIVGGLAAVTCCTHFALFRLPYSSTTRISKTVALRLNGRSGAHMFRLWSVRSKSQTLSPPSPSPFRLPSLPYLHSLTPFHPLSPHSPYTPPQCQVISCASFDIIAETSTGQADFWLLCVCVCLPFIVDSVAPASWRTMEMEADWKIGLEVE